jgi:hypothetical protein
MKKITLFLNIFLLCVMSSNTNAQVSFDTALETVTGTTASDMMVADFNNDGKMDIFIKVANTLEVLLGNGTNIPSTPIILPTSSINITISTFAKGDVNNDGKLDIIVYDRGPGKLYTLIGDGLGGFTRLTTTTNIQEWNATDGIKCGDFNNDGNSDVIISSTATAFKISLGNGNGIFQAATTISMPLTTYTGGSFDTEDCNNDGNMDIVSIKGFAFGNGLGTLNNSLAVNTINYPNYFVRDDFNNDGFKDLAVSSRGINNLTGKMTLFLSAGTSDLLQGPNFSYFPNTIPVGIAKGDFNNDGILDIATCDYTNNNFATFNYSVSVYVGTGYGNFDEPFKLTLDAYPKNIAIADINTDGKLDIIVATTTFQSANPTVGKLVTFFNNSTLSNSQFSENVTGIYPNPTTGIFNIKTSAINSSYSITNVNGKLLSEGTSIERNQIDIKNLQNGLYFVTIKNDLNSKTFKIIKN